MKRFFSLMLVAVAAISMAKADQLVVDCGNQAQISATPQTGYHFVGMMTTPTTRVSLLLPRILPTQRISLSTSTPSSSRTGMALNFRTKC